MCYSFNRCREGIMDNRIMFGIFFLLTANACKAEKKNILNPDRISCPSNISDSSRLGRGDFKIGILTRAEKFLFATGLVDALPEDTVAPVFSEEHIDEWDVTSEGAVATWEYNPGQHDGKYLSCQYRPKEGYDWKGAAFQKANGPVIILIPIPDPPGVRCKFIRDPEKWKYSATCELNYSTPAIKPAKK